MKLVLPLMGCGVGWLDATEVLKIYKAHFNKEVPFECEVVVYGYSIEDYEIAKSTCI